MTNGPILIIEDDADDQLILQEIFAELNYPNEILYFENGEEALVYLNDNVYTLPFLILSDINMPKMDGFSLRDKIRNNEKLDLRCIPYLFFTTAADQKSVIDAYSKSIQGFFIKPSDIASLTETFRVIIEYWQRCTAPNRL